MVMKNYFLKFPFILFLFFAVTNSLNMQNAFALSGKVNPVGTNLIVEIAKKQNPAVVFVHPKPNFNQPKEVTL